MKNGKNGLKLRLILVAFMIFGAGLGSGRIAMGAVHEYDYDFSESNHDLNGCVSVGLPIVNSYADPFSRDADNNLYWAQVILGSYNWSYGGHNVILGTNSKAGEAAVAAGFGSYAYKYSVAIGYKAHAGNLESITNRRWSVAIGYEASAIYDHSIAIGALAKIDDEFSIAIGNNSSAGADSSTAIGWKAKSDYENSVAIGADSSTSESNSVSVGSSTNKRKIMYVKDGVADSDAATVGQLKTFASQAINVDAGIYLRASHTSSGVSTTDGTVGKNLGYLDSAIGNVTVPTTSSSGRSSLGASTGKLYVLGESLNEDGTLKTSVADNLIKLDQKIGEITSSYGILNNDNTISQNLMALEAAIAKANQTIDFSNPDGTATTNGTTNGVTNGEPQGTTNSDTTKSSTTIYSNDGTPIAKIAQGSVSSGDTGFVSGGQVWNSDVQANQSVSLSGASRTVNGKTIASNQIAANDGTVLATFSQMKKVSSTDTGFVSGSDLYNETRKGIAESNATKYHISANKTAAENMLALDSYIGSVEEGSPDNTDSSKNTYKAISSSNTVSQNLQSLDTAVYTLDNKMDGLIKQDGDTIHIGGGETSQNVNVINIAKIDGTGRVLSGIADGVGDTDAVNMRQYNALANRYGDIESRLTSDIRSVGAGAAALAALHPGTYDPTDKMSFAVGFGHYKDANAGALGAFYRPNADTLISVGGTVGNGNPMFNVGFSFKLGERGLSDRKYGEMMDVSPKFDAQDKKIIALEKTIDLQSKKIATLESDKVMQDKKIAALEADNQRIMAQMAEILKKVELSDIVKKTAAAH